MDTGQYVLVFQNPTDLSVTKSTAISAWATDVDL
jgi:hypothetical protein